MNRGFRVETSADYKNALGRLPVQMPGVTIFLMAERVAEFIEFKRANGLTPFTHYGDDKPSSHTRGGDLVQLLHENRIHHCHLGLVGADPIVVYRVPDPRRLVIFCVTTHAAMFRGDKRLFVRSYPAHFPATLSRRPRLGRRPRPER